MNTCTAIALLLRATLGEEVMQVMVVSVFRAPLLFEVFNHLSNLNLNTVFSKIVANIVNYLPVFIGQFESLRLCQGNSKVLGPLIDIDDVALFVGSYLFATDIE
jgi:hypothetical protein